METHWATPFSITNGPTLSAMCTFPNGYLEVNLLKNKGISSSAVASVTTLVELEAATRVAESWRLLSVLVSSRFHFVFEVLLGAEPTPVLAVFFPGEALDEGTMEGELNGFLVLTIDFSPSYLARATISPSLRRLHWTLPAPPLSKCFASLSRGKRDNGLPEPSK